MMNLIDKFKKQSSGVIFTITFAKFLFGIGLGVLLVAYLPVYNWEFYGWLIIILSVLLHIPGVYNLLIKK
ncbi:MAG: hypothetical protein KKF16_05775 [Euryarchaeota archaeon]|nr:hypothetical protein [Euryarchaeota archaeon]MBV1729725.1 hypothetical protein [Methanobacterium sp.]MBV1755362.1 hypothetical protein [Methanobacterium sp.]